MAQLKGSKTEQNLKAAFAGELGLHAQTLIAEEVDPRFSCLIRLWIRADVIVVIESKGGAG